MAQCEAQTISGTRCGAQIASPSPVLCRQHQGVLARGNRVVNYQTGKTFPKPR